MITDQLGYSGLDTYGRCPNAYKYRYVQQIQRKRSDHNLYQGSVMHGLLLAEYYGMQTNHGTPGNVKWAVDEYLTEAKENPLLFTDEATVQVMLINESYEIVLRYLEHWVDDDFEVLHVEEQFIVTLDSGLVITMTPDLVIRDKNGFVWIYDHKSTKSIPKELPFADFQALLYYAGVKAIYPELRGFVFNYLRKKTPTEPRLTKTGEPRVAYLSTIDTTYEILKDFLRANDLIDDETHRKRLAELRDHDGFFRRDEVLVDEAALTSILADVDYRATQIRASIQADQFPRTFLKTGVSACERCEFATICKAELMGWDTKIVLESYEPRDTSYKEYESD